MMSLSVAEMEMGSRPASELPRSELPGSELSVSGLLRTWRVEVAKLRVTDVARALGVGKSTVSNWESGLRRPDDDAFASLEVLYATKGALSDLAAALATPSGLPARLAWWGNFAAGGFPVWAWCRPGPGVSTLGAHVEWGQMVAPVERRCAPDGFVVTWPTSVPDVPLRVSLDAPGWVDFGRGTVPHELGLPAVPAVPQLRLDSDSAPITRDLADRLGAVLEGNRGWASSLWQSVRTDRALRAALFGTTVEYFGRGAHDLTRVATSPERIGLRFSGSQFRRLRQARGLSQATVASRITSLLPRSPVTDSQVALVEAGGVPRVEHLASRLDAVYRADGETFLERVECKVAARGTVVHFPRYWAGPVWLTLHSPFDEEIAEIKLRWGPRQKRLRLRSGMTLSFRRTGSESQPLLVDLPTGWAATAGMGRSHSAVEIDDEWMAVDGAAAERIARAIYDQYIQLFGHSPEGFLNAIRQLCGDASQPMRPVT